MTTETQILAAARQLGTQIAQTPAAERLADVLKKLESDVDAQRALTDLNRHAEGLAQKQAGGQPIEVEEKRKLDALQQAVIRNPLLRDFQAAQMDYVDLMRRVDEAIQGEGPGLG